MAKEALAVKYRPKVFEDMTEQSAIKDILMNQLETKTFQHGYLFTGPAGTGKTTSARIFANMINDGKGNPIEVDAASNSGVDNIRQIIEDAKRKPLDAEYKIFIVDECHSLSMVHGKHYSRHLKNLQNLLFSFSALLTLRKYPQQFFQEYNDTIFRR